MRYNDIFSFADDFSGRRFIIGIVRTLKCIGDVFEMKSKYKPILISVVVVSVVAYLIYTGLRDTMTYYLTVNEVLAQAPAIRPQTLRLGGNVSPGSVSWDPKNLSLRFVIQDGKTGITVDYKGVVPDSFKPGREVIVEGTYMGNGRFEAHTIMPKCASKYT